MKNKYSVLSCIGLLFSCLAFCSNTKSIHQRHHNNSFVDKEILVSNQAELNSAIAIATPGSVIIMNWRK